MSTHHFVLKDGRFLAEPGHMERVNGQTLRAMFLPKLTCEGQKALSNNRNFVRCQLKHYGVQFEEKDFSGNGTTLLKKALQAGRCDQVPQHIRQVREQMYTRFLDICTLDQLADNPEWLMDKYFRSSGIPDHTKTTGVYSMIVGQTEGYFTLREAQNDSRLFRISEAASQIPGLHYKKAMGSVTRAIYLGWDAAAVEKAVSEHLAREPPPPPEEEIDPDVEREQERAKLHADYLNTLTQQNRKVEDASPVGSYVVNCKHIKETWGDDDGDFHIYIDKTGTPGVFQANFDFGAFEGIMMIGLEKDILEEYCLEVDRQTKFSEDEYYEDHDDSEGVDSDERTLASGAKRKAPGSHHAKKPKKLQTGNTLDGKYFLKIRCRETGEGEIQCETRNGTIKFDKTHMATFRGAAGLPDYGEQMISFFGRKISDVPSESKFGKCWAKYSERRHDYEWARRWR